MGKLSTTSRVQVYNRLKHTAKDLRISAQALNTQWEQTACGCKLQMYHCVTRMTNLNGVFFFLFYIIRLLRVVARVRENDSDGNSRSANWLREANTRRAWEKYMHTKLTFGRLIVDARQCTSLTNLSYMCSLLTSAGTSVTDLTCWIGNRGINSSGCLSIIGSCQHYSKFCEVCLVRALGAIRPQHSDKQILHSLSVRNQADRVHREGILHHHQRMRTYIQFLLAWSSNCTFANKDGPISASERLWAETMSVWIASWMMQQQTLEGVWFLI